MIEPPGQALVRGIFEINDRVFVAVKLIFVKGVAGTMHCRRVENFRVRIYFGAIKFGKKCGRRNAVEAVSVIKNAKFHNLERRHPDGTDCKRNQNVFAIFIFYANENGGAGIDVKMTAFRL